MCMTTPGSVLLCLQSKMKIPQDFEVKHLKNIFGFDFERLQASIIEAEANPGGGPSQANTPTQRYMCADRPRTADGGGTINSKDGSAHH